MVDYGSLRRGLKLVGDDRQPCSSVFCLEIVKICLLRLMHKISAIPPTEETTARSGSSDLWLILSLVTTIIRRIRLSELL